MAEREAPLSAPSTHRVADTIRFYDILARLEDKVGGRRALSECNGRMDWPLRGVYFFFEAGETRSASGHGDRVVRIGTHALTAHSGTTLWKRLSQHRGTASTGNGNHRGSIFRLLVGGALARRGDCPLPPSWGVESSRGAAARKLGTTPAALKDAEAELESRVSAYIGRMQLLWLNVSDAATPDFVPEDLSPSARTSSVRGRVERNAIALLSHTREAAADTPSQLWLGAHSDRPRVRASGLWNNNHVEEHYDRTFLDELAMLASTASNAIEPR